MKNLMLILTTAFALCLPLSVHAQTVPALQNTAVTDTSGIVAYSDTTVTDTATANSADGEDAEIEDRQEGHRTSLEDLSGQEPLGNVLGVADLIHAPEENHGEERQKYGVVTNGVHPQAVKTCSIVARNGQHKQPDQTWPQCITGTPEIDHPEESTCAAHPQRGDRIDRWHDPE